MLADDADRGDNGRRPFDEARLPARVRRSAAASMETSHVQQDPDRQPRRDRLPRHQDRAAHGHRAPSRCIPTPMPTRATCAWPTRRCSSARRRRASATCVASKILDAAKATGAQAVHPGYGFLSRERGLRRGLRRRPASSSSARRPSAIRAMGSKSAAKALMDKAGVPLTPGYHGDDQDPAFLRSAGRAHRLPGADQGQRRRRRQGHAPRRQGRGLRRRAGLVPARGARARFGDDAGAGREVRAAAAPHRDPGLRRHARQLRLPVRARLLGAAPPPEGARGSAGARA